MLPPAILTAVSTGISHLNCNKPPRLHSPSTRRRNRMRRHRRRQYLGCQHVGDRQIMGYTPRGDRVGRVALLLETAKDYLDDSRGLLPEPEVVLYAEDDGPGAARPIALGKVVAERERFVSSQRLALLADSLSLSDLCLQFSYSVAAHSDVLLDHLPEPIVIAGRESG